MELSTRKYNTMKNSVGIQQWVTKGYYNKQESMYDDIVCTTNKI